MHILSGVILGNPDNTREKYPDSVKVMRRVLASAEDSSITMMPPSAGNWGDIVVACYGASMVKSFGDLSALIPNKLQGLPLCTSLEELILGRYEDGYENLALASIADVSYLKMLKTLNVSNCKALSGSVDMTNCSLIENIYARGSSVSSFNLPVGGYLRTLHLPETTSVLEVVNHTVLDDFILDGASNLTRIRVENTPGINLQGVLVDCLSTVKRLRLVGVDWDLEDETLLRMLVSEDAKGKSIDALGYEVDDPEAYPVVTGKVYVERIQGSLLDTVRHIYPNLDVTYGTKYHKVTFIDYDGSVVNTQDVDDRTAATTPRSPSRANDVRYIYSFRGWDKPYNTVVSDMTITSVYSNTEQLYPIEFYSEDMSELLYSIDGVSFGGMYVYDGDMPYSDGRLFAGWSDEDGNLCEFSSQMPSASAKIDGDGRPITIKLKAFFYNIEMPTVSKALREMNNGERLFVANAIADMPDGVNVHTYMGCKVTYYADNLEYVIINSTGDSSVSVSVFDSFDIRTSDGHTLTIQIMDFKHDYVDDAWTSRAGITYGLKDLLAETRQMNAGFRHGYNFSIGSSNVYVNDTKHHSSNTDAALKKVYEVTDEDVENGFCDIKSYGQTYLTSIKSDHADGTTETWLFGEKDAFYAGYDCATYSGCSFYVSDFRSTDTDKYYKIGKMLKSIDSGLDFATEINTFGTLSGSENILNDFGGIVLRTVGVDTINTAENSMDGNGVSRIRFYSARTAADNNFTEVTMGSVISIPVVAGDVITVNCYGSGRNYGGWPVTDLKRWMHEDMIKTLPISLVGLIIPVYKKSLMGNRSKTTVKSAEMFFPFSNSELGGSTERPLIDEGDPYPIFTDNMSRIRKLDNGLGAADWYWERTPTPDYVYLFYGTYSNGFPSNLGYASNSLGITYGFCSGKKGIYGE